MKQAQGGRAGMQADGYLVWPLLNVMVVRAVKERRHEPVDWMSHERKELALSPNALQRIPGGKPREGVAGRTSSQRAAAPSVLEMNRISKSRGVYSKNTPLNGIFFMHAYAQTKQVKRREDYAQARDEQEARRITYGGNIL